MNTLPFRNFVVGRQKLTNFIEKDISPVVRSNENFSGLLFMKYTSVRLKE